MTETVSNRLARGTTRYCGEWHLIECADRNQGMCCDTECEGERRLLREMGVDVDCPPHESWGAWADRLDAYQSMGMNSVALEVTHG